MGKKNSKMKIVGALVITIAVMSAIALVAQQQGFFSGMSLNDNTNDPNPSTTPAPTSGVKYDLSLPWVITVTDENAGGVIATATVSVYRASDTKLMETGTTSASGTVTLAQNYMSNEEYWIKVAKSNAFEYYDVTVPQESSGSAQAHYTSVSFYTFGGNAYAVKVYDPSGTALVDANNVTGSVAVASNQYPSLSWMIGPPADNSGVQNTYDPIKVLNREVLLWVHISDETSQTGASHLTISNMNSLYQSSATDKYYGQIIDPAQLTRIKNADGTYASTGIATGTITFDASGMVANDIAQVDIAVYAFDSWAWFNTHGSDLTGSVALLSGSPFTIEMYYDVNP